MLLIEIALAIVAWKRGWRWRTLLPFGIGLGAAFLMGAAIGASGGDTEAAMTVGVLAEIGILISLVVMALRPAPSKLGASPVVASEGMPEPPNITSKAEGRV